jgi:hypothetical protein
MPQDLIENFWLVEADQIMNNNIWGPEYLKQKNIPLLLSKNARHFEEINCAAYDIFRG